VEKTEEKYYIRLQRIVDTFVERSSHYEYKEVEGEPLVIPGFEELDLFAHRAAGAEEKDIWVVSEGKTGNSISGWGISKEEAITLATEVLNKRGIDIYKQAINNAFQSYHSPRYG